MPILNHTEILNIPKCVDVVFNTRYDVIVITNFIASIVLLSYYLYIHKKDLYHSDTHETVLYVMILFIFIINVLFLITQLSPDHGIISYWS